MTDQVFETRLRAGIGRYADGGVRPIDAHAIAVATVATGGTRGLRGQLVGRWLGPVRVTPRLVVVALLTLLAIALAVTAVGLQTRRPPVVTDRPQPSPQAVIPSPSMQVEVTLTPRIAYVQDGNVIVAGTDGSDPVTVLDDPGVVFTNIHWLSDGRHIVVESADQMSVLDLATGEHHRFDVPLVRQAPGDELGPQDLVAWRPGGDELAAVRPVRSGQPTTIVIVNALSGERREIPTTGGLSALAWSSDGTRLGAYDGRFIVIDVATGQSRVVDNAGSIPTDQATWSADLGRIAYLVGSDGACVIETKTCKPNQTSIYVVDASSGSGGRPVNVAGPLPQDQLGPNNETIAYGPPPTPAWSPDGTWLAYRTADGLAIVHPDGTGRRDVVTVPVDSFRWQADSAGLMFTAASDTSPKDGELFEVDLDGGAPRSLGAAGVSQIAGQATGPADVASSPIDDGSVSSAPSSAPVASPSPSPSPSLTPALPEGPFRLFVGADPAGACDHRNLEVDLEARTTHAIGACGARLTPDGRHLVHGDTANDLVTGTTTTFPGPVSWSPKGRWVTIGPDYSAPSGSTWTIATWDASRLMTVPRPYMTWNGPDFPDWSPDERYIAIATGAEGYDVIDLTTGTQQAVGAEPSEWSASAGGGRIGYVRDGDAWIADADGGTARNITRFAFGGASGISLSPDGGTAAVTQERSMWLIDIDGGRRRVDTHALFGDQPFEVIWSPDGQRLALIAGVPDEGPGHGRTVMIDRDGRTLANVEAGHAVWSPAGDVLAAAIDPGDIEQHHTTAPVGHQKGTTYLIDERGATQSLRDAWQPTWSPDGKALAVLTGAGAVGRVEIVGADGTGRHPVSAELRRPGGLIWLD